MLPSSWTYGGGEAAAFRGITVSPLSCARPPGLAAAARSVRAQQPVQLAGQAYPGLEHAPRHRRPVNVHVVIGELAVAHLVARVAQLHGLAGPVTSPAPLPFADLLRRRVIHQQGQL